MKLKNDVSFDFKNGIRGILDLSEYCVDATFASAKKGRTRRSNQVEQGYESHDSGALVFLSTVLAESASPRKANRKKAQTRDGRKLRRYKRRRKIERLFAWLQNFRRIVARFEYHSDNSLGFVYLACIVILLRNCF